MLVGGAEDFALRVHLHLAPEVNASFVCLHNLNVLGKAKPLYPYISQAFLNPKFQHLVAPAALSP